MLSNDKYTFFWRGPFSQWHPSRFEVPKYEQVFSCAEQYMMYSKAILFRDFDIADQIMKTNSPKEHQILGRQVKNFDLDHWNDNAKDIVFTSNYWKFMQNYDLLTKLLKTGNTTLVEASPYDKIWGIGLDENTAINTPPAQWPGTNWLGLTLTHVRDTIKSQYN